ncbi:MAG: hypothetical protein KF752_15645 [Pirellulaceae bacterium]|nr:hypothetical protein [Pirellulaceae bacterium]
MRAIRYPAAVAVVALGRGLGVLVAFGALACSASYAAERPTFNKNTCDPRPDILPERWLDCWDDYRSNHNRPRHFSGWLAHVIEPSSQEAMVWCEAKRLGLYQTKHSPPLCRRYMLPKPWEQLQTGPQPKSTPVVPLPLAEVGNSEGPSQLESGAALLDNTARPAPVQPALDFQLGASD